MLGALVLAAAHLCAQTTPPDTQANCTDPLGNCPTTNLQQTPSVATQQVSPNYPNNVSVPGTSQRMQDANNQVYIDSAGNEVLRQPNTQTLRQQQYFPPDPITDLQKLARTSIGEMLPVFGRDLFQAAPSTFAPGDQLPVTPDYVVGPGDELLLRLWGPETFNSQLVVDRSGAVYIPKVGAVHVAGLRFDELQPQITTELSRTYRNFHISVNLGRLRSIQVYVVGEARRPGAYTVSSLSTVLNALFASGGPNVQGSLRHIQVRRAGATLPEFDLYDLVLRGDKSQDIRLESGDTIFIPPVGAQVALGGSVRHPAIYEVTNKSTLGDVLELAGGFSAIASSTQVTLERIEAGQTRQVMDIATTNGAARATVLHDGDVLYAGHITAGYQQTVTIRGALANPGRFPWHEGMRLSDILPDRRSLLTNDYWRERNRLGVPVPLFEPLPPPDRSYPYNSQYPYPRSNGIPQASPDQRNTYPYDSNAPTNSYNEPYPNQLDQLYPDQQTAQPDLYLTPQSTTSAQDVLGAGLFEQQQQQTSAQTSNPASVRQQFPNTVGAAPGALPESQPGNDPTARAKNKITIPAPEIDWSYAVIERLDPKTLKNSLVPFNLGKLVQDHDPSQNLELQAGDIVTILSQNDVQVPRDLQTKYVRLEGEFAGSGVYSVAPDETLDQLVARAGGLTGKAYLYGSSFTRESARVFQQQRLDEYISSLSTDMERETAVRAASSNSGVLDPNSLAEQRSLIAQLRALRATGRVVLEFQPASTGVSSIPRLPLENGDVFRVPSRPNTISVVGAVYGQNVFLYDAKRKLEDYVSLAGKPNRIADTKHAFIIRADGSIYSRERAQRVLSNTFESARINPGDAIVIPEKLIKPTGLRQLIDFSQVLSSFGLAAAAINVVR